MLQASNLDHIYNVHFSTLNWTVTFTWPSDLLFMLKASNLDHRYICWHWIEFWPWHDLVTYIFVFNVAGFKFGTHIYICWHWIELWPLHDLVTYFLVFYVTGFKFGPYIHLLTLNRTVTFTLPSDLLFYFLCYRLQIRTT